jgi:hypothetical protein
MFEPGKGGVPAGMPPLPVLFTPLMIKLKSSVLLAFAAVALLLAPRLLYADSLVIDTDYRLRGISYTNLDFDAATSSDAVSYYSQRLRVSIIGKFAQGLELGSRITALGVVGSSATIFAVPYPNTTFSPYIENAYIKLTDMADYPVDLVVGKQSLSYGDGLIIDDNGTGFNALRLVGRFEVPYPVQAEIFTAKLQEGFHKDTDYDVYGAAGSIQWLKHLWEIAYFQETDKSGTMYTRGGNTYATSAISKQFYDLRIGRREEESSYQFEIAKQGGYLTTVSSGSINFSGLGFVLSGALNAKNTRLGNVTARALLASFSGASNPLELTDDQAFSPDQTRRFDGLEKTGYGELFAATPLGPAFTSFIPSPQFSGTNVLSLGADFSPLYAFTFGVTYFLYSASQGPSGAPEASGFERLYGAEFSLGVELDLSAKYVLSKYTEARFSFARYTPPKSDAFWPKRDPATRYMLEIAAKF